MNCKLRFIHEVTVMINMLSSMSNFSITIFEVGRGFFISRVN